MKKLLIAAVLFVAVSVNAQEKTQFEKDAYQLVEITTKASLNPLISQMTSSVKQENAGAFMKDIDATLPELFTEISKGYMKELSHDDIKAALKFYESEAGKNFLKKQPVLMQKGMQAGQSWGMKLQGLVGKYK